MSVTSRSMQTNHVPHPRRCLPVLAVLALCLSPCTALAQELPAGSVDAARATLEKWVEASRILSKEKRDWALGREMLEERIAVVKRELESLRNRIAEADKTIAEADRKRVELAAENTRLEEGAAEFATAALALEKRTRELLARLPDPLRERVRPLSQRIPEPGGAAKVSLGERFQNVIGILNEANKFHRDFTAVSEVRTLGNGANAEVTTLYVGIGQAFYVSAKADAAGVGTPSPQGWTWIPADAAAGRIADAIAILRNEKVAAYVQLPIRID